ncbi:MAG: hypothetical protein ACD_44C00259G0003 [uncultured bacterium]|nr:MAG: hypothetical protein ACD_44C00259G0003 [uncultured bacterium]OGT16208.1 MAG: hypothetical protein A3B69_00920 [Gammaproteobacteria bacterium RIFCSPHIGHO2_02_FULL_38_33]OGT24174.1 MAG: hypothetical protein A2W47_01355 [Gammaproteobacteria bacterium RIFCSPHIGHO2_12_38_15]OGT69624.1 MAG: hypothetical protein A3I12_03255 [Gammaproteobacteria bacterium RIFCSPLOWO2_02_FULL_38_11]OGT75473.1 MAG: hypothetical protein A3G71_06505 [Gammaproteobacteria bacterium RIFCSPLOWO2_12_FULL_38_14]
MLRFHLDHDRFLNSVKTALACLIGFLLAHFFKIPMSAWILITILVVMSSQINFGGVVIKSSMQFIGTVAGALVSGFVLIFYHEQTLPMTLILFFSIFVFSYLASSPKEVSNAGLLGATTLVMILLSDNPTYQTALLRFFEISLAIFIAFFISKFFFPIHAYRKIYDSIAEGLTHYITLYEILWEKNAESYERFSCEEIKIINIFSIQRKLIYEASNELSNKTASKQTYNKILKCQRETFRYICLMHHAYLKIQYIPDLKDRLSLFNQQVDCWLRELIEALKTSSFKLESTKITNKELIPLILRTTFLPKKTEEALLDEEGKEEKNEDQQLYEQNESEASFISRLSPAPTPAQQLALDAFFFCALNLVRELRKLTRLVTLLVEKRQKNKRR